MFPISDAIKATKFPFINIGIILVTVYVFVRQIISPFPDLFIQKYALIPALINFSDFSTLYPFVTAIFLHGGILHIVTNMWFLWVFGDNVESYFGHFLYPFIYLGCGIAGNILQYFLMPHSTIATLGASGAIAGVLGAYYELYPYARVKTLVIVIVLPLIIDLPALLMLGYWFILQLILGAASIPSFMTSGGIAFFAHVAGFLTGATIAFISKRVFEH